LADPILKIAAVTKSFGENHVLRGIDFDVGAGEIVGLLGPNGCGKSTLLNVISGFAAADAGQIMFAGNDITAMSVERIARNGLVRTFQLPSMPHRMTVAEILAAASIVGSGLRSLFGNTAANRKDVDHLLGELALAHVRDLPAGSLSGGQKKLLSIALALSVKPRIICLDEPTAGVHPNLRHHMVQLLRKINADGVTLLIIEHDMHFIRELCNRCIVLDHGAVIANCAPVGLTSDPRVVEAYLGSARQKGVPA
jgi:branched-chain amino acid transport system ATP-binding protein